MIQFRVYLRAELGKLGRPSDAACFLEQISLEVRECCELPPSADQIAKRMATQEAVDNFVADLSDESIRQLAEDCSQRWRKNDVFKKLQTADAWPEADIPIEQIKLQQAEPSLGDLFRENEYSLRRIASDERILASEPYCHHRPGEPVRYATCLALRQGNLYRIFDGMHRAIQLVRNGKTALHLCYAEKP